MSHTTERPSCVAPPAPDLLDRIVAGRQQARARAAGLHFDAAATGVDPLPSDTLAVLLGRSPASRATTLGARPAAAPVLGTRRALVLLVDFSDHAATESQAHYVDMLFSSGTYPTGSMHDFYLEASYGQLSVDGLVSGNGGPTAGWYRAPQPKTYYTNGNFGFGGYPNNSQKLVEDLVALAGPYVDFSDYDNDGDGVVDALVVIAAGVGGEVTGNSNDIWSHAWAVPTPIAVDGVLVSGYFIAPEDGKVGVMAHELGHSLMFWPDLYDIDYSSSGTGEWDLMAGGSWNGGGDRPAHPCAYCKTQAGWVTTTTVTGSQAVTIPPYSQQGAVYRQPVGSTGQEYFLISNREPIGFDADLPGSGLIVEHVDESMPNNTDENHYLVDIEQCDGRRDLNLNANRGDAGDAYPAGGQDAITPDTVPSTDSYDGTGSGLSVTDIQQAGTDVTATISTQGASSMSTIIGSWDLTVDWGNDGGPIPAAQLTFNANGTWTYSFGGGQWIQVDGTVFWHFDNAPGLVYTGSVTYGTVAGAMGYASTAPNPGSGSFYMVRATGTPAPGQTTQENGQADLVVSASSIGSLVG